MAIDWTQPLTWVRVLAHLVTFIMVGLYYRPAPEARHRYGVSLLASIIAGSSLALAVLSLFVTRAAGYQIFDTSFAIAVAVIAVMAGGDVARLLPRQPWTR